LNVKSVRRILENVRFIPVYLQSHLRLGDRVVVVSNLEDRDLAGRLAQIYEERTGQEFTLYLSRVLHKTTLILKSH